jgi:hypothetical protein
MCTPFVDPAGLLTRSSPSSPSLPPLFTQAAAPAGCGAGISPGGAAVVQPALPLQPAQQVGAPYSHAAALPCVFPGQVSGTARCQEQLMPQAAWAGWCVGGGGGRGGGLRLQAVLCVCVCVCVCCVRACARARACVRGCSFPCTHLLLDPAGLLTRSSPSSPSFPPLFTQAAAPAGCGAGISPGGAAVVQPALLLQPAQQVGAPYSARSSAAMCTSRSGVRAVNAHGSVGRVVCVCVWGGGG